MMTGVNARDTLKLPPYWRDFIAKEINDGRYGSVSKVIEAGLTALEREQESFNLFLNDAVEPRSAARRHSHKASGA
jgi:putative addiction module CopG family antidote